MKKLWIIIIAGAGALLSTPAMAQSDISVVVVPNPVGIPEAIIVVALLTFAILRKGWIRILLSICIVIWGVFFIAYDVKIAAPLLAVGTILAVQAIWALATQGKEAATAD